MAWRVADGRRSGCRGEIDACMYGSIRWQPTQVTALLCRALDRKPKASGSSNLNGNGQRDPQRRVYSIPLGICCIVRCDT